MPELNTGDWVGEICFLITPSGQLEPDDRPNMTVEQFDLVKGIKQGEPK